MKVNDYGKLAGLLVAMLCVTALSIAGRIPGEAAAGVIVAVAGYMTGNGVLARRGSAPSPVLVPRNLGPEQLAELAHHLVSAALGSGPTSSTPAPEPATAPAEPDPPTFRGWPPS